MWLYAEATVYLKHGLYLSSAAWKCSGLNVHCESINDNVI